MPENHLTLFELNSLVKGAVKEAFPSSFWIVAEISELKVNYSGHCYLELVEKDPGNESLKAKARATIWSSVYRMLQPYFETTTRTRLSAGIKVLVKASVEFHELYGFSLNITDIEPAFTLGEMARQKQEVIERLRSDGVFELNRQLIMPRLPRKIALISSETAAGYGDFMDQLLNNPSGYKFYIKLFPAYMQGDESEASIINAMEKIFQYEDFFDVLVIIRGGGSTSDLGCFNGYWLASHIAQFSLPVLTGIGHEQDETVADLVAHTRLKTPTAVAEFLLSLFEEEERIQLNLSSDLVDAASSLLNRHTNHLNKMGLFLKPKVVSMISNYRRSLDRAGAKMKNASLRNLSRSMHKARLLHFRMHSLSERLLMQQGYRLAGQANQLRSLAPAYIKQRWNQLDMLDQRNHYNDPRHILSRGYSITLYGGKPLRSSSGTEEGGTLESLLFEGSIKSMIMDVSQPEERELDREQ
jgi:exodeoxyribonuclease VII large subunit